MSHGGARRRLNRVTRIQWFAEWQGRNGDRTCSWMSRDSTVFRSIRDHGSPFVANVASYFGHSSAASDAITQPIAASVAMRIATCTR
jgi:hypothetical protein